MLASLSLAMLLSSLGTSVANIALPTLTEVFGVSFQAVQWVVLAYLLGITTVIVSAGRLGDLFGKRRLLLAGLATLLVASFASGVAPTLWLLIVARGIQGAGAAIMMSMALALAAETVAKERIGSAIGLMGTMSAAGTALGPTLGGALIALTSWRLIFLLNVPIAALTILLVYRFVPNDAPNGQSEHMTFDSKGTLLAALTLAAYALAMTIGKGTVGLLNLLLLMLASLGVALFIVAERRSASPLIQLSMFSDSALSAGLAMNAIVSTVMMATLVVGPFYLSKSLGLGSAMVGAIMSIGPLVVAVTGVPAGRLVDKAGSRSITIAGVIAMAVGSAMLVVIPRSAGVPGYIIPITAVTFGYALFQTANSTAMMKTVEATQRGVISGMLNLSRNLGLITGASVMGAIFLFGSGSGDIKRAMPGEVSAGMHTTFATATVLVLGALALAFKSRSERIERSTHATAVMQS